jgi:hypothetical protein
LNGTGSSIIDEHQKSCIKGIRDTKSTDMS